MAFWPYLGATLIGGLPSFMVYSYLGSRLPTPEHIVNHKHWKLDKQSMAIIVACIVISVVIGYKAKEIIHNHEKVKKED